jgi:chromosome segregation ATPase
MQDFFSSSFEKFCFLYCGRFCAKVKKKTVIVRWEAPMATSFKTSVFGGFDKEDVISFIEKTAQENQEKVSALEADCTSLREENASLTEQLLHLQQEADALRDGGPARVALEQKLEQLSGRAQALEAEVSELRTQAQEYQNLKNHIADIEISAHRRTEEFRTAMIGRMRELLAGQRVWCAEAKEQYAGANAHLLESLQEAQALISQQAESARQTLSTYTPDQFDRFSASLSELERSLDDEVQP